MIQIGIIIDQYFHIVIKLFCYDHVLSTRWQQSCTSTHQKSLTIKVQMCFFLSLQITGAILLAVGLWGKFILGPYISLIAENSTNAPYVLIGTGTTIIVFGLFGCFATCRGSPWMLKLVRAHCQFSFRKQVLHWTSSDAPNVSLALSVCSMPCSCLWFSWQSWSLASRALFSVMR